MQQYGYKISGMARGVKFDEAEVFLDKKLKDYEKMNASFSEDGSRTQVYKRKNEDGTENEVTMVKNVTESGILVFSDLPLKFFKFGGWVLYLRDIVPTIIFGLIYWLGYYKLVNSSMFNGKILMLLLAAVVGGFAAYLLSLFTYKLLDKNRSELRIRFIQLGGIISIVPVLYFITRAFARWSVSRMLWHVLATPYPAFIVCILIILEASSKGRR